MINRANLVQLYNANFAAQQKVARNAGKLAWLACQQDATAFHNFNMKGDMERYIAEAKEAAKVFADACAGLSADEIVSIVMEAQFEMMAQEKSQ